MFGINGSGNGSVPAGDSASAAPMVPNSEGIDEPVQAPPVPLDSPPTIPSAPPMPAGPAADSPAASDPVPVDSPAAMPSPLPAAPIAEGHPDNDLIRLKQEALQSLAPLVDHLDQTPEEKFKTTMMMLQASDNPELVKEAYAAANAISDEKVRAQALLDVVNEINYFTQHAPGAGPAA